MIILVLALMAVLILGLVGLTIKLINLINSNASFEKQAIFSSLILFITFVDWLTLFTAYDKYSSAFGATIVLVVLGFVLAMVTSVLICLFLVEIKKLFEEFLLK